MNHVAFWVPMLVLIVAIDLDKLLEDRSVTSCAADSESGGIMEVAEDFAIVFVVTILRSKNSWTRRAREMLYVELGSQGSDVTASKSTATFGAEEVKATEIIRLTQRK